MAVDFKPVDRDQQMLLPPDLREWLPDGHLAWLVLDVVGQCDLGEIAKTFRRGGVGRQAYDPEMLTALLVYAYCTGERSSRQIERACVTDVAFRVICAQQAPDHTTIARFRSRHDAALAGLFGQVLTICARAGMGRVGVVSVDGTKVAGQASPRKNYSEKRLRKLAGDIIGEAEETDAAEDIELGVDRTGDELPDDLAPGSDRAARIQAALDEIERERQAAVTEDTELAERKLARARRRVDTERRYAERVRARSGSANRTRRPVDERAKVKRALARVKELKAELAQARSGHGKRASKCTPVSNPSDPESHLMFVRGKGFLQGYNAQVAVSDDHLLLATDVCRDTTDRSWFVPMMDRATASVQDHFSSETKVETVLADSGYCSVEALTAPGPDRLIATGRKPEDPSQGRRNQDIEAMAERLQPGTADREIYQRRQATVEPVIGHLKDRIGLRRFSRRGLQAAKHELAFAGACFNILRLATG